MSQITDYEIQGYIDGVLDDEDRRRVERECAARPDLARRVSAIRSDMALLRRYFTAAESHLSDERMAETVRLIVEHGPTPRRRVMAGLHVSLRTAAMMALIVVGALGIFGIKLSMTLPAYADAAALAYLDASRQPSGEERLFSPQALVDWINENTGLSIRVPFSEEHGYELSHGRITLFDDHAAGLLVYEDPRQHRVAIFVTRVDDTLDEAKHIAVDRSVYIKYWARNGIGIVIAAADQRDLDEFAQATEQQIHVATLPLRAVTR